MDKTEEAIQQLDLGAIESVAHKNGVTKVDWCDADTEALRHLIAEARKVELVREWTKKGYKFFPEMIDGFEWAQCEVHDIISAPDTETEVQP